MKPFHCSKCDCIITVPYGICKVCKDVDYFGKKKVYLKSISTEQRFDRFGNPICIICGRVTKNIGKHLETHNMNIKEYRKKYKIKRGVKLSRRNFIHTEEMRQRAREHIQKINKNRKKSLDSDTNKCYNNGDNGGKPN